MIEPDEYLRTYRTVQIIRHCTTALNSKDPTVDRIRGWSDYHLSDNGREHARALAKKVLADRPDVLMSSDLMRAVETATIIAEYLAVPLHVPWKDFRPWDLGNLVGQVSATTIPLVAHYAAHEPDEVVGGGESFNSFRARFMAGLLKAFKAHSGKIGIVTHHRCERLLRAWGKAGYRVDGEIDEAEFQSRGESTGYCGIIGIPLDRLAAVVINSDQPRFGDGREERWLDYARGT